MELVAARRLMFNNDPLFINQIYYQATGQNIAMAENGVNCAITKEGKELCWFLNIKGEKIIFDHKKEYQDIDTKLLQELINQLFKNGIEA